MLKGLGYGHNVAFTVRVKSRPLLKCILVSQGPNAAVEHFIIHE